MFSYADYSKMLLRDLKCRHVQGHIKECSMYGSKLTSEHDVSSYRSLSALIPSLNHDSMTGA